MLLTFNCRDLHYVITTLFIFLSLLYCLAILTLLHPLPCSSLSPPVCDELHPCEGLGRYATFKNFGMAFLLLFRVSTGDNWNGIMKVKLTLKFGIMKTYITYTYCTFILTYTHIHSAGTRGRFSGDVLVWGTPFVQMIARAIPNSSKLNS